MIINIVNIIAITIIPILSVWIAQWLQNKSERRKDKLQVFRHLMSYRDWGYIDEISVNIFNSIPIVFRKDKKVLEKYRVYKESLFVKNNEDYTNKNETELNQKWQEIKYNQKKMLEVMAKSLKYNINIEEIETPYIPNILRNEKINEANSKAMQLGILQFMYSANLDSTKKK